MDPTFRLRRWMTGSFVEHNNIVIRFGIGANDGRWNVPPDLAVATSIVVVVTPTTSFHIARTSNKFDRSIGLEFPLRLWLLY